MRQSQRFILTLVFVLAAASMAFAQARQFRVTAPVANVRLEATTRSKVIGQAHAGDILTVVSAQGNWVEVSLPSQDGLKREGYIYLSLGSMEFTRSSASATSESDAVPATLETKPAKPSKTEEAAIEKPAPEKADPESAPPVRMTRPAKPPKSSDRPAPTTSFYGVPHTFGLGGQAGGFTFGLGANIRYWSKGRLGFQVGISHFGFNTGETDAGFTVSGGLSVIQFAPSVLYRFGNPKPDDTMAIMPYVGGGLNIFRSTASATASGYGQSTSQSASASSMGGDGFFGVELFFKSMPKLGVGGDLGYYSTGTLGGVSVGGLAYSIAAHWYMK